MHRITAAVLSLLVTSALHSQQWYCQNPTYASSTPTNRGMVAFEAGGKGFFGYGLSTNFQHSASFAVYDPATNTTGLTAAWSLPRSQSTAFSVGGYGYVGLGFIEESPEPAYVNDVFQRFDPVSQQFTGPIAPFPGGPRLDAVAFAIGNKAYVGGGGDVGIDPGTPTLENDLWAYDPANNTWTARADMPANISGGRAFAINGKGFVIPDGTNTLWEYDQTANSWTTRAAVPGPVYSGRCVFTLNGKAYLGTGSLSGSDVQTFQVYDPLANTWSVAAPMWAAFGRRGAVAFSIGNSAFVYGGERGSNTMLTDVWMFGPATTPPMDTWTQRPFLPANGRSFPIAFTIGNKGYAGGGSGYSDFWEYDPSAKTWTARAALPANADEGFSIGGNGYVTTTAATGNFFAYDPVANTWSPRADLPGGARSLAASFSVEGKGYVGGGSIGGVRQADLWAFDPASNSWAQRANRPGSAVHSASGFAIGNKGYMGGGNLGGSSASTGSMHRYDPITDTWTAVAGLPLGNKQSAQAFVVGNKAYLGGGFTGGPGYLKRFDVYDPSTNTWTQLVDLGGNYRFNGVGFSIGDKGYVLGGQQNPTTSTPSSGGFFDSNTFWEFNPSTIAVSPRICLEGPYDQGTGLMSDALRTNALLPAVDPYGANGYPLPGGTYSDLLFPGIPTTTSSNAVVDRVVVELRDGGTPSQIKASRHVWLQRDGDVVDMDGTSPVRFTVPPGSYHVAIRHRNHLGVMTATPIPLGSSPATIDFRNAGTATYGTAAQKTLGAVRALWAGDATFDGNIRYTGSGNDRDPILTIVGGTSPNNSVTLYSARDVNMDGQVKYTGSGNDRDIILTNVGSTTPNNTRVQQLP